MHGGGQEGSSAMRIPTLLLCASLSFPAVAAADSITLPPGPPDGGNCGIFGCGTRYQQIFSSSLFPSAFEITSLTFFNTTAESAEVFVEPAHYRFRLGITATGWDMMTTDFSTNATLPLVTVADFTIVQADLMFKPGPGSTRTIDLAAPFLYLPRGGNLILDVLKDTSQEAGDGPVYIDNNGQFTGVSSANNFAPGGVEQMRFVHHASGIITKFNGTALAPIPDPAGSPTPEPASIILLTSGAAIAGAARPRQGKH